MSKPRRPSPSTPLLNSRLKRDLTQHQVASAVGLSQSGYSKIERGATTPDVRTALRIAEIVGASVAFLWPSLDEVRS